MPAQYFDAVFTLRADWTLIGLYWINITVFDLFVYVLLLLNDLVPPLSYHCARKP